MQIKKQGSNKGAKGLSFVTKVTVLFNFSNSDLLGKKVGRKELWWNANFACWRWRRGGSGSCDLVARVAWVFRVGCGRLKRISIILTRTKHRQAVNWWELSESKRHKTQVPFGIFDRIFSLSSEKKQAQVLSRDGPFWTTSERVQNTKKGPY